MPSELVEQAKTAAAGADDRAHVVAASGRPTPVARPQLSQSQFVLGLIRPYRGWLCVILGAMLVETLMSLAAPWPLKLIVDNVAGTHPAPHWLAGLQATLGSGKMALAALAAAMIVAIAAVGAVASYIDNYFTESVGQWVAHDLRTRIYDHLHQLSLAYYDSHQTGSLISTITDDVDTLQDFASSSTLSILVDLLTIVGMLGLMFWLDWDFTLIALAVTPVLLFFVARFKRAVKQATHEVRKRESDLLAVVQQGLESIRAVQAFGRQALEEQRLGSASHAQVSAALKARRVKSLLSPIVAIVVALCTAIVLWRGAALVVAGAMTVGALIVFLAYLAKFFKPVQDLAKMTNTIAQATVGIERIRTVLDADAMIPERPNARPAKDVRGEIAFEHVAFGYDSESPVLKDVNFTISPGQLVGIVGATGGGKSTVVSLLPRFYDATGGRITLDGVDVRDYQLQSLRSQIGYVLQDTVLFSGTIRDNIAYGRPDVTDDQIVRAAKLANADEFIVRMTHGYDSLVGERGLTLSGGQRQRIGIARAIIRDSAILLLDEPTAALDTESEKLVIDALERLMHGRTVITIAHRLSTIRHADQIIVLQGGVVAEKGTHEELLALGGLYSELHRAQSELEPTAPAA